MKQKIKAYIVRCDKCNKILSSDVLSHVFYEEEDLDTLDEQIENAIEEEYWTIKGDKHYCSDCL